MRGASPRPRPDGRQIITGTNRDDLPAMQRLVTLHQAGGFTAALGTVMAVELLREAHAIAESFHEPGNLVVVMGG